MSSRLPSRPGSVPEYIFCDDRKPARPARDAEALPLPNGASRGRLSSYSVNSIVTGLLEGVTDAGPAVVRTISPERRCSSRTFRYGYLVTT